MKNLIFNPEILAQWKQVDPEGANQIMAEIMQIFFCHTPAKYQTLRKAAQLKDLKQIELIAHSVKSDFGIVGAEQIFYLLKDLEAAARDKDKETVDIIFFKVEAIYEKTLEAVKDCQTKLPMPA